MTVWTFQCERLGKRRYKTFWSEGATMFHYTFKDAMERYDLAVKLLQERHNQDGMMVASFVDCPKVKLAS